MRFDTTYRYFAFSPAILGAAEDLRETYGATASTAPNRKGAQVKTLLCGLDNAQTGKLRALILGQTAQPIMLSDGRLCLGGYWTEAVKAAFESGTIDGEELTVDEVNSLKPETDD